MDSLVVTGASGFLGRYLLREAADAYDVLGTYHSTPLSSPAVETRQVDLTAPPFDRMREFAPDYVVHAAGFVDVDGCERSPELARELNVEMTEHVASLAADAGAHLVYLSTDAVFDGTGSWWSEGDTPNPINVYGETKLAGERAAARLHDSVTVVRTNFFGWSETDGSTLAEWMIDALDSGAELTGFEDVYFTPLYAGDVATYLLELLEQEYSGLVHLAGSERLSKLEFAHRVADVFGFDPSSIRPIQVDDLDLDAPRGNDLSLDASRAESLLGRELPDASMGLERMRAEGSV